MYRSKILVTGLFAFLILFSFIPTSQAELFELIVEVDMEKGIVYSGDKVTVTGRVVDHAYKPIAGGEILIRIGSDTMKRFTKPDGGFIGVFDEIQRIPGTYIVNVVASSEGKTGLVSTQFQVKGDTTPGSLLQEKLASNEARGYIGAEESDFEKNPIGQILFKYYQGLLKELIKEKREAGEPNADEIFIEEQRTIAENLKNQAISEFNPGAGVYNGTKLDYYISGLDPKIRELVSNQMNFTKNNFFEAQNIKNEILENGGTFEEARKAYLDRIAISKETLEQFNEEQLDKKTDKSSSENNVNGTQSENQ